MWILLAVVVLVSAVFVVFSPAGSPAPTKGELCKLAGGRYSGRTSQGKPFCFTLWKSGGRISEYAYGFRDSCGAGTSRTTGRNGIPVAANGSFTATFSESYVKGRISGSTASGTLRSKRTEYGAVPPVTCDSGIVRWTAQRKG